MIGRRLVVGLVALSLGVSTSYAATFTHNFDMSDDYTQYLDTTLTSNASVYTEIWSSSNPGYTRYWKPTTTGVEGHVVYKYDLGFQIQTASLYGNLINFSEYGGQLGSLDVSKDAIDWDTVATGYLGPPLDPIDVSAELYGSETAYVRARILSTRSTIGAQFLRTYEDYDGSHWPPGHSFDAPNVYQFQASNEAIPEPNSVVLWSGLGIMGVVAARRRNRTT